MVTSVGRPRDPDVDARIVAATRAVLIADGLAGLTIARVAKESGVSRPAIYRRFSDRDDLARAVLYDDLGRVADEALAVLPPEGTVEDRLVALIRPVYQYYAEHPALSRTLLRVSLLAEPPWEERFAEQIQWFLGGIHQVFEDGRTRGELAPGADTGTASLAFFSMYLGCLFVGFQGDSHHVEAQLLMLRTLLTQHLDGMRPSP